MKFPYELGAGVGRRGKIGLLVLREDQTAEYEISRLLPAGVALYVSRVESAPTVSKKTLAQMKKHLPAAAALLPPVRLDAVGYACTSGAAVVGEKTVAALVGGHCAAAAVATPVSALLAACRALGVCRLAFLSPYAAEVSAALREVLRGAGIATPHFGGFCEPRESVVARISPQTTAAAAAKLYKDGRGGGRDKKAEAIFISCTNLQTFSIIPQLEKELNAPVLSSNLVLGWQLLRLAGIKPAKTKFSLFAAPN